MKEQLSIIPVGNRLENEIFIQKVLMTPDLAKKILATMVNNRNIKERSLSKIVEDIKSNQWVSNNGETIKINSQGRLVDGQHRLEAIIKTNTPLELYISFNCHVDSINTVDTGSSRSLTNVLKINNIKYYNTIGSIVQAESVIAQGSSIRNISNMSKAKGYPTVVSLVKNNLEYLYFVCKESEKLKAKFPLITASFYSKYFNIFYKIDKDVCFDFFRKLSTGDDCDAPIFLFRQILIKDSSKSVKKLSLKEKEALFIKCWNHYVDGNDLKNLRWQASSEEFPKVKRLEHATNLFI